MLPTIRISYKGKLQALTPVSSATGTDSAAADIGVLHDHGGRPMLSGPTVTGILRRLAGEAARFAGLETCDVNAKEKGGGCGECVCCDLFGSAHGKDGHAARVTVYPANLERDCADDTEVRDHVAIDRRSGAAANHAKFTRESVPPGAQFDFHIEYHPPRDTLPVDTAVESAGSPASQATARREDPSLEEAVLAQVLLMLQDEDGVAFGGGRTAGLGRLRLINLTRSERDLSRVADLQAFLRRENASTSLLDLQDRVAACHVGDPAEPTTAVITFSGRLRPLSPFIAKAVREYEDPDTLKTPTGRLPVNPADPRKHLAPLPEFDLDADVYRAMVSGGGLEPCLPGTGIKGPLRAHAERILRTRHRVVNGADAYDGYVAACAPHLRQGKADRRLFACDQALRDLAGEEHPPVQPDELSSRDTLRQRICPICQVFGNGLLAGRLSIDRDGRALHPHEFRNKLKLLDFVAIGRWSGAPRDGAKFNARVFFPRDRDGDRDGDDGDMEFRLSLSVDAPDDWALMLVGLLLRDMSLGRLHFGHGRSKGFGRVRLLLDHVTVRAGIGSPWWEENGLTAERKGWLAKACIQSPGGPEADPQWFLGANSPVSSLLKRGQAIWKNIVNKLPTAGERELQEVCRG